MRSSKSARHGMTSSPVGLEHGEPGAPIVRATAWLLRLPLARPVVTARRTIRSRQAAVLRLEDADGRGGVGEASPLAGFGRPRRASLLEALRALLAEVPGRSPGELLAWLGRWAPHDATPAAARFALETAALDLLARRAGRPLARLLSPTARTSVDVNALLVGETADEVAASALEAVARGFNAAKLKVGGRALDDDLTRVRAAREVLGARRLRLDANGAWDVEEAVRALRALAPYEIEYVEQPIPPGRPALLARVRRSAPVPIAADEDAHSVEAARALLEAGSADVVVVKPAVAGGIRDCRAIAEMAAECGVDVVVTSALDGGIGVAAAAHLAASLGNDRAHGLSTGTLLRRDTAREPLAIRDGVAPLPSEPGLGVEPAEWVTRRAPSLEAEV